MEKNQFQNGEIDQLVKVALESTDELSVPYQLADATIARLRKKILLKEMVTELAFKICIGLGSLGILAGAFILTGGQEFMEKILDFLRINKPVVLLFLTTSVVIIILDQILIRYINADEESASSPFAH